MLSLWNFNNELDLLGQSIQAQQLCSLILARELGAPARFAELRLAVSKGHPELPITHFTPPGSLNPPLP